MTDFDRLRRVIEEIEDMGLLELEAAAPYLAIRIERRLIELRRIEPTNKAALNRPSEAWIRADEREKAEADIAEYAKVSAPLLSLDIRAGAYRARATTEATPVNDADHGPQKYAMKGPADYIAEGRKAMYAEMMEWNRRLSPGVAARIMAEGPKP